MSGISRDSNSSTVDRSPTKPPSRRNSLHEKFVDPSFLADDPGFQQRVFPQSGSSTAQTPSLSSLQRLFGLGQNSSERLVPGLHPIKTPHLEPISHPELAFSPTDIGIWEIHKESKKQLGEAAEPGRGFFR